MPRFFFHARAGEVQSFDDDGTDCRDLSAAYDHALHLIRRTMPYMSEEDMNGWMINIATSVGTTPLTVLFPHRRSSKPTMQSRPFANGRETPRGGVPASG
jgi:hypothetical protein